MNRKSVIIFVLAAGAVAAALVFDGVSHRRASNQAVLQNAAMTTQPVDAQADTANAGSQDQTTDPATAGAASDANTAEDAAPSDDVQAQADGDGTAADATNAAADAPDGQQPPSPQPIIVPAGTTLAVRLGEDLGSGFSKVNQHFSATLDRDVVVRGQTVIAAGAGVTGRVVAVRPAGAVAGEANLQLKITSVRLDNGNLAVVTSARSFGPTIRGKNKVGRFFKGLAKRAAGQEHEVLLAEQSQCSFTLARRLEIQ